MQPRLLAQAPELGALALLEAALEISVRALLAEHPSLNELAGPELEPPSLHRARQLLASIHPVQRAVRRYRVAALAAINAPVEEDDDDLPF